MTAIDLPDAVLDLPHGEARDSLLAIHEMLGDLLPERELAIYEAGGGSTSFLPFDVLDRARVTVVDIDPEQIKNNSYADVKILGDIQTHRFAPESFDLITCYNVIEHLPDVEAALLAFSQALRKGGLVLIGAPNPHSLSGVVTRFSPHWFHVWYYRHIRGDKRAGLPGQAPFPTFFHPLVALPRLEEFAEANGLRVVLKRTYESPRYPEMRARKPALAAAVDDAARMMNLVLPATIDVRHGDYHVILQKI
jgi:SAM-dependent methyltransferase